jgi:hypothetical protein
MPNNTDTAMAAAFLAANLDASGFADNADVAKGNTTTTARKARKVVKGGQPPRKPNANAEAEGKARAKRSIAKAADKPVDPASLTPRQIKARDKAIHDSLLVWTGSIAALNDAIAGEASGKERVRAAMANRFGPKWHYIAAKDGRASKAEIALHYDAVDACRVDLQNICKNRVNAKGEPAPISGINKRWKDARDAQEAWLAAEALRAAGLPPEKKGGKRGKRSLAEAASSPVIVALYKRGLAIPDEAITEEEADITFALGNLLNKCGYDISAANLASTKA